MKNTIPQTISKELGIQLSQVSAVIRLLEEGATVPFIARYRKEMTGELDEVAITSIRDRMTQIAELDARRSTVLKSLRERELLTDELLASINDAKTLSRLEDIYLPHRPKRRTRAMIARERGLEPLADALFKQPDNFSPETSAVEFISDEKDVPDVDSALKGARDIIAEWVNENSDARQQIRELFVKKALFESKVITGKEEEGSKFRDYFEFSENIRKAAGHRVLAMFRGEKEGILLLYLRPDKDEAIDRLKRLFIQGTNPAAKQVELAIEDSYSRLISSSMEVEARMRERERAGEEAITVFCRNLRELLMSSPLGRKSILAIDPGFRTGSKIVCLDPQGKFLFNTTIYLVKSERQRKEAAELIPALCKKFGIDAVAIGNGTASRETESFIRSLKLPDGVSVIVVNESGASVYSASDVAREEFPNHDITVRGAVSIGRRLMDPLAELVKIDPKSIGVGQYQHDVDQSQLKQGLDDIVVSCVNAVGVEVNTASKQLLSYVSGLGPSLAENIVAYRDTNGPFKSRKELHSVPRLGPKAFEQCAGFLRIRSSENPLDSSAVHPERYPLVKVMAGDLNTSVGELISNKSLQGGIDPTKYVSDEVGLPTLRDIISELSKPGRDPRATFEAFEFSSAVHELTDLKIGMKLPGIVTNVTNFGAFVDVGVHQDGLVHISQISDKFVRDPAAVVKAGQKVKVTVLEVDPERKRISLSMRAQIPAEKSAPPHSKEASPRIKNKPRIKPKQRNFHGGSMSDAFSGLEL